MTEVEDLVFAAKYPFSDEAKKHIEEMKINFDSIGDEYLEAAKGRVEASVQSGASQASKRLAEINSSRAQYLIDTLVTYPLAKILAALNDQDYIKRKFAEAEARDVFYFLQFEDDRTAFHLAKQIFDVSQDNGKYILPFEQYMACLPKGAEFKLVNAELSKGKVYLEKTGLAKLVSEKVRRSILSTKVDKKKIPKMFSYYAGEILKGRHKEIAIEDLGPADVQAFPPCIKHIIASLRTQKNVGHQSRFVLSTFFSSVNMPIDSAVQYFAEQENFNEKRTKYHLEHARGTKGGVKYSAPSCAKMETYGLCFKDRTCRWHHPVSYYENAMRRMRRAAVKK
ncbi:MAG: hypothetical protein V1911_00125 [Candidatus Micrarchaeota archaeon]